MAVGGVLDERQFGGVTEDLVECEGGGALGGDDHLGAVGQVLVGFGAMPGSLPPRSEQTPRLAWSGGLVARTKKGQTV